MSPVGALLVAVISLILIAAFGAFLLGISLWIVVPVGFAAILAAARLISRSGSARAGGSPPTQSKPD